MKRFIRFALPLLMAATVTGVGAPAAQAHTDICSGQFVMQVITGLGIPVQNSVSTTFTMGQTAGACLTGGLLSATGTLNGACALANGTGTTNTNHGFTFQLVGTDMVFDGQVTGTLNVIEDPVDNGSCSNNTAIRFVMTGTLLLTGA